jgi:ribonuclease PH
VALALALQKLASEGKITSLKSAWIDTVSAISIGMRDGQVLTDLDYNEDSTCDVDMNFVVTGKGEFVEVQGTGEGRSFSKADLDKMTEAAMHATAQIREIQKKALGGL